MHLLLCVKAAEVQLLAVLPDVRLISSGPAWRMLRVCGLRTADLSTLYAGMPTAVPAVVRDATVVRAGYTQAACLALCAHFGPAHLTVVCRLAAMMQLEGRIAVLHCRPAKTADMASTPLARRCSAHVLIALRNFCLVIRGGHRALRCCLCSCDRERVRQCGDLIDSKSFTERPRACLGKPLRLRGMPATSKASRSMAVMVREGVIWWPNFLQSWAREPNCGVGQVSSPFKI